MFTTIIVQPIFNLLVFIYAILPGHNFGLALIIFTVLVRMLMWPLIKKQLHHTKVMRQIQPEVKRIKQQTKGDRQKEQLLTMALYKEKGISPFGPIGIILIQIPILIGLYSGLHRLINDPHQIVSFSYPALQNLSWMKELSHNIHLFDGTLFGVVDLTRSAVGPKGAYIPALLLVVGSAAIQYFQSKQLIPTPKDARKLRDILKQAGEGKQADQAEVNAAVSRNTVFLLPAMVLLFTINLASGLSLYWLTGGLVAFIQQSIILREDEEEIEKDADSLAKKSSKNVAAIAEGEVVKTSDDAAKNKKAGSRKKRRRK